jgi:heptosyltransferase III
LTNFPVSSKAAPLEAVLNGSGLIHEAIRYPLHTRSVFELWTLFRRLRGLRSSVLVYLTPRRGLLAAYRDFVFFRLCGFKEIIGIPLSPDLQRSRIDPKSGDIERECERLARSIEKLGAIDLTSATNWDLKLTEAEDRAGGKIVEAAEGYPLIAINMGGKVVKNDWGKLNWHALFEKLAPHYPSFGLLVVGSREDEPRAEQVASVWPGPVINACNKLTPRESAAALRRAKLFVGHDSGPLHLSAACGLRCVGLFGDHMPPKLWHPYGAQHRIIHHMDGVKTISVDEVLEAIISLLPPTAAGCDRQ